VSLSYFLLIMARSLTYDIDTGAGERQFGRKAQLSNITAAKT
jgi:hypothetical protein